MSLWLCSRFTREALMGVACLGCIVLYLLGGAGP